MLQTRPEVHCDCADLHLYLHLLLKICKKNRNAYNQMKAAVAVRLWIDNIILSGNQRDVILYQKRLCDLVYIIDIRTDHTYAGCVIDIFFNIFQAEPLTIPVQLFHNTVCMLQPCCNRADWIALVTYAELCIKHFKFCPDFFDRTCIHHHQLPVSNEHIHKFFRPVYFFRSIQQCNQALCQLPA